MKMKINNPYHKIQITKRINGQNFQIAKEKERKFHLQIIQEKMPVKQHVKLENKSHNQKKNMIHGNTVMDQDSTKSIMNYHLMTIGKIKIPLLNKISHHMINKSGLNYQIVKEDLEKYHLQMSQVKIQHGLLVKKDLLTLLKNDLYILL